MAKTLMGLFLAAGAVLLFSIAVVPRITPHLNAAKPRAVASMSDLTGIWSPPRTPKGFLPYNFSPDQTPPMQPWAVKRCDLVGCGKGTLGRAVDDTMDPYITSCAPFCIPRLMNHVGPFEIIQTPRPMLILFETGNSLR